MAKHSIIQASTNDMERAVATITAAFIADPFNRWMFPDAATYLDVFPKVVRQFMAPSIQHKSTFCSEDLKGVTIWLPPGVKADEAAVGDVIQNGSDPAVHEDLFAVLEKMDEAHPHESHWYLPLIGVDPTAQGKGYGGALITHALHACDQDHLPAYLETATPANLPLYQRFGFEITEEIQIGTSPTVWTMLRPAQ